MVPAGTASMISDRATMALMGRPAAMDLAAVRMSGAAPASCQYSEANIRPVRQKPDWTSSAIRRMPWSSHTFLRALTQGRGGEEAAFSLEGLQNEGGHLVGGGALLKDILEALEAGGKNFLLRQTVGTAVKVGGTGPGKPRWPEAPDRWYRLSWRSGSW